MKNLRLGLFAAFVSLHLVTTTAHAIEGLKLKIVCPHVVLSWPSIEGENYIVQYRETLGTNTPWLTLTNYLPAESGTNTTTFTHSNRVDCPVGQVFGMMRMASGDNAMMKSASVSLTKAERAELIQAREVVRLTALFETCKEEGREPYEWEIKNQPPLPPTVEEIRAKILNAKLNKSDRVSAAKLESAEFASKEGAALKSFGDGSSANGPQPAGAGGGNVPGCGFYRVVRNGVHLGGVTNGMVLSGTVDFPYELGATNIGVPSVTLYANGVSLPMATSEIDSTGRRVLRWNTAFSLNGSYDIYAECNFDDEWIFSLTNSVTVTNLVHFGEFTTDFGEQMWVYAELGVQVANVYIDMYTEDRYLGAFFYQTTNGVVSFLWNLVGPNNQLLTNETFHGVVNVNSPGTGQQNTNPPPWMTNVAHIKWNKQYGWYADDFVVAWGNTIFGLWNRTDGMVQRGVVDILANPAADYPYALSPGNTFHGTTYRLSNANTTNLLAYLAQPNYRNFFFYGHGNASRIGDYVNIGGGNWLATIDENEIRTALGNLDGKIRHPYRFVFLNTCKSAAGLLCDAFGIRKFSAHRSIFRYNDVKARAFVGFLDAYPIPSGATQFEFSQAMLGQFFDEWSYGANLDGIVTRAKQNAFWPLDPSATIYGATNLYRFYPY